MKLSNNVFTFTVALSWTFDYVSAVLCYDCNSAFDPRCGEEFDPFSLGIVNCSLKDPLDHIPDVESSVCRSIKMEIKNKVRIVRQCGYLTDNSTSSCRRQSGNQDLIVTYCTCDTDLCNTAQMLIGKMALILVASVAGYGLFI